LRLPEPWLSLCRVSESSDFAASHIEMSVTGQVGFTAVVSTVNPNSQILEQSVIHTRGKITGF
jgi:hypothetical protein